MVLQLIIMSNKKYLKPIISISLIIIAISLLYNISFANTYINNSIEIEVMPESRSYDYGDTVTIDINIENKNRYGKLHYKITDVYSGGGFNALNLDSKEKVVDSLESSSISVDLRDKFYVPEKRRNKGAKAYGLTDKEYAEFERYRNEKIIGDRLGNKETVRKDKEQVEIVKSEVNATILVVVIVILIMVIIIVFIWFIIKSKSSGGFRYMSVFLTISLLSSIFLFINKSYDKTYASDIYQENVKYNKTISTQVSYDMFDCTFDVKIEYYFVNTIPRITDLELDIDNDTLPDYLEVLYLTDMYNNDTDNDGLYDGVEVYRTYTDPLRIDTDNNGINDGDEDYDKDKLTNIEEKNYGTDYDNADTDFDGLSDYDEINGVKTKNGLYTYQTDPLNEDTDGDGLRDNSELKLNLDPTNPNDANTKVAQVISTTSVLPKELTIESPTPISFRGELIGDIDENVKVKKSNNSYYDNIEGLISIPIIIDTTYDYNAGLKITFDLMKYKNISNRIQLCRIENGKIVFIANTYVSNNILYGDCYSGEYCLIDSNKYMQDLNLFFN